jgi:drug/metabolite transporter (DMT)-like permease
MAKPDLGTREGRRLYAAELGRVARFWRYAGLGLVAVGAILLIAARLSGADLRHSAIGLAALAALVVGWALAIVGIVKRTLYHRRRMAG